MEDGVMAIDGGATPALVPLLCGHTPRDDELEGNGTFSMAYVLTFSGPLAHRVTVLSPERDQHY